MNQDVNNVQWQEKKAKVPKKSNVLIDLRLHGKKYITSEGMMVPARAPGKNCLRDIELLRYHADTIAPFDGNPKLLHRFICYCENILRNFENAENPSDTIKVILFDAILGKHRGRAAELIGTRIKLNSWGLIRNALTITFSDQRGIDCLIQYLISVKPHKNKSYISFGIRIQDARSLLFAKLNTLIVDEDERRIKIEHYVSLALKTFLSGRQYHMQLEVRLKNPENLEEALAFVIEEEHFMNFSKHQNAMTHSSIMQPSSKIFTPLSNTPMRPLYKPITQPPFSNPNFARPTSTFNNQSSYRPFGKHMQPYANKFRNTFPLGSNNFPMRFSHPNQQYLGNIFNNQSIINIDHHLNQNHTQFNRSQPPFIPRQSNVIRNQQQNNPNNTVTPMDTSSYVTQRSNKPKFAYQELHAQQ
ncbi:hypothetical protein HUJ04_003246, partial [Dendroctonus ponderosae]